MKPRMLALLVLLPLAPSASGQVVGVDASAAGTTSFNVTDWSTGMPVVCSGGAVFALEVNGLTGAIAWASPHCGEPGVATFTFWCTDACFHDCWFYAGEMTCWNDGVLPDGTWFTDQATLRRDGAFTFQRDAGGKSIEARGTLLVTTWPDGA